MSSMRTPFRPPALLAGVLWDAVPLPLGAGSAQERHQGARVNAVQAVEVTVRLGNAQDTVAQVYTDAYRFLRPFPHAVLRFVVSDSQDRTVALLRRYAKKDKRVEVVKMGEAYIGERGL